MLIYFQNSFTDRLSNTFAAKWYQNIPPHLKRISIRVLPCEILMSERQQQPEQVAQLSQRDCATP